MKKFYPILIVWFGILFLPLSSYSQLKNKNNTPDTSYHEVRKGSTIEYSVSSQAIFGEEFSWEVTGGIVITEGALGEGTATYPSVIGFKTDLHTITVQWHEDDKNSEYYDGIIKVQKKSVHQCQSVVEDLKVRQWSEPIVAIDTSVFDFDICSGDIVGGYIVLNFTGAPNYNYSYSIKANGLFDETGNSINTKHYNLSTEKDTAHIILPELLINPSNAADDYFTIDIEGMHDAFVGDGIAIENRSTFIITVHPTSETGVIDAIKLNRR